MRIVAFSFLLWLGLTSQAMAGVSRHHVLIEFSLPPELSERLPAATGDQAGCQVVVLKLNGTVYFEEDSVLRLKSRTDPARVPEGEPPAPPVPPAGAGSGRPEKEEHRPAVPEAAPDSRRVEAAGTIYPKMLLLENGDYLTEAVFYHRPSDLFFLAMVPLRLEKHHPASISIKAVVPGPGNPGWKKYAALLKPEPARYTRYMHDHMIWAAVGEFSRRNPEEWPALFVRVKLLSLDVNYEPYGHVNGRYTSEQVLGEIGEYMISDQFYRMSVILDNLQELIRQLALTPQAAPEQENRIISEIEHQAGQFSKSKNFDKKSFESRVARLQRSEQNDMLRRLVGELDGAVRFFCYNRSRTVQMQDLHRSSPNQLAAAIRCLARFMKK